MGARAVADDLDLDAGVLLVRDGPTGGRSLALPGETLADDDYLVSTPDDPRTTANELRLELTNRVRPTVVDTTYGPNTEEAVELTGEAAAGAAVSITVSDGVITTANVTGSATADASGDWDTTVDVSSLDAVSLDVLVSITDAFGTLDSTGAIAHDADVPAAPTMGGATAVADAEADVTWTASGATDVASQRVEVSTDAGANWSTATTFADNTTATYTYAGTDGASVSFRVVAIDDVGNSSTPSAASTPVTLDGTAPVAAATTVVFSVDEDLQAASVEDTDVTISGLTAGDDYTVAYDGTTADTITVTVTAVGGLSDGNVVTVTQDSVLDLAGNAGPASPVATTTTAT